MSTPQVVRTACTRDCPDACGILATVQDGRVLALRGDPDHPVTRGYLCERTSRYLRRQYDPSRLQQPLVRRDGSFVPVSWDEALDLVAAQLDRIRRESGPEAVLHYRSGGSLGLLKTVNDYFFECFGGARVKKGDICSGAGEAAQEADMGISDTSELSTLRDSRTIFLWGRNLTTSFTHHLPELKEARSRGATVVLIDPCPGKSMQFVDLVVRPRPGCDRFLALAIARVIDANGWIAPNVSAWSAGLDTFLDAVRSRPLAAWAELADVEVRCVEYLADLLAHARPASLQVGWGLGRRKHGGVTVRVLDALGALSGNLGVRGGGVAFTYRRRSAFDCARYTAPPERRGIPEPLLGEGILAADDPPVRAVVIDNANPVAMLPDSHTVARALATREFVVVLEQFMTDTAERAHVVLPVTTMLEEEDFLGAFGHEHLTASRAVVPPATGTRTDLQIYQGLAARLGFGERLAGTPHEWGTRLLARVADEVDVSALQEGVVRNPISPRVLFEGQRFPTPDGRFHFVQEIDCSAPEVDPEYPFTLGSFSTPRAQSSQWARPIDGVLEARCHPSALPGFADGAPALLESRTAALRVRVRLDPCVRRDLVLVPKGGWLRHGHAANALVPARLTDMGLGAAYYDEPVRIRRVE